MIKYKDNNIKIHKSLYLRFCGGNKDCNIAVKFDTIKKIANY